MSMGDILNGVRGLAVQPNVMVESCHEQELASTQGHKETEKTAPALAMTLKSVNVE